MGRSVRSSVAATAEAEEASHRGLSSPGAVHGGRIRGACVSRQHPTWKEKELPRPASASATRRLRAGQFLIFHFSVSSPAQHK